MAPSQAPDQIAQTIHHEGISDSSKSFFSRREATLANDLPRELLVYIFETAQNIPSKCLSRHFPFILGSVSQYWRQVVFTEPKLWSHVDISYPRNLNALQVYLDRSKPYPIDLHLFYDNALSDDVIFVDEEVTQLTDILQPHYSRCRSIKFLATCAEHPAEMEMMKILGSMSNSRYPVLKRFLVQLPEIGNRVRPTALGHDAPNLTSVSLRGLGLSYCRPPINAVTELHLAVENDRIDGDDFFGMLQACAKSLITLCVYDDLISEWPAESHSIAMPSLRHLRIFGDMVEVSSLEELTVVPIIWQHLSRLYSEDPNNSKFPALKSLTLASAHAEAMALGLMSASACFPGIGLLILPNYYKQSSRLSFLMADVSLCALAYIIRGFLIGIKNESNGLAEGPVNGSGGGSLENTMPRRIIQGTLIFSGYCYYLWLTHIDLVTASDLDFENHTTMAWVFITQPQPRRPSRPQASLIIPRSVSIIAMADLMSTNDFGVTGNSNLADFSDVQKATLADELPSEILIDIFEMAQNAFLPSEEHLLWRFPLVLGMVSRYWRQVAYGAPMLWSNVDISHYRDLDGLQVYLSRSKDLPIDLHFTYEHMGEIYIERLIGILRLHYPRCRSIRLGFETPHKLLHWGIMSILDSLREGRYPILQRFHVEGFDSGGEFLEPRATVADALNLTNVRLRGLGLIYCRPPLTAATELHLAISSSRSKIPYTYFYGMLGSCQALITLCVYDDLVFTWPTAANLRTAHDMPSLRYLRIFGNMLGVSELLLSISAPYLKELTIAPFDVSDLDLLLAGASRNTPRFPALKSLTLAPICADAMKLSLANTCFPGIKLLVLPNYYKESFTESFNIGGLDPSEQLWPELDGLAVRDIDEGQDQVVLYEFIEFRQSLGVPLGTLYLDSSSMPRMTRMDWLKDRLSVVEADPWKIQCQNAFYSDEEDRFLGEEE
ncbi:uncharacterized protein LACBIDRAFT_325252 [Laccaria bicolor S238N-H82]|uniref:Predicted protein n=1 Tax=Laccaria bicolor (strain S238N-H82 / ATCC MYA-4686) TaxID=486041 RepID=B0D4B7_LACBS|nr:uncharacterized protein LACBIDRAFT_325252 [Laccaria bicolor S238N-H82]EDR10305.1 predicted protein [Laccaria bicolor S238N-H82]|eukprot:XP_001878755.1 predicted protein [Laccaria bicolor S238N-H82]